MTNNNIAEQNSLSARIYGQSGALKDLLEKIHDPKIQALEHVLHFKKNYAAVRQKKMNESIEQVRLQIQKMMGEMKQLTLERDEAVKSKSEELNQTISRLAGDLTRPYQQCNFLAGVYRGIKRWTQERKIKCFKNSFQKNLRSATKALDKRITSLDGKIKNAENNVQSVAKDNISGELRRLDEINNTILNEKYLIYGSIGEANVINELKKLPNTYHVINDFNVAFSRPIYNQAENDRIYSVQVDHLVVGPTGVFIIETKYWSDESISNEMFFSPVKQVKRAGFALFVLVNDAIKARQIMRLVNHWGERKISPKQIVASVNSAPHAEFQYVKVLGIEKLNSYITYGKQEFTTEEVQDIVDYLLHAK
ncbi:MAG: Nuclease-related domain protein [Candidatus Omnitrophica bacterium ADurb.Bin277]|nr:MAG: Nuclease-related domain protein [Candidatus Omnitrophica bacterium ADurb.Bin277]